jgi:hypothetical protein
MKTKSMATQRVSLALVIIFSLSQFLLAEPKKLTTLELINIAGKQRMLSQRISKDYLYKGGNIVSSKADSQLLKTLKESLIAQKTLQSSIKDSKIINLIEFVAMNYEDIADKTKEKFNKDNAQYVLDLSESILEGNEYIMTSLNKSSNLHSSKLIDMSARQAMLSQRIAKYYIAYQLGIKDKNTVYQMNKAVKTFTENHKILMKNKTNSPEINVKFKKIDRLWKIVYKFYLDIETGGLPLIVFNTTDDISARMDEIASMYLKIK